MKNLTKVGGVFLCLCMCTTPFFAQKPNYSGVWVLNLEKSKLESQPESLTSSIFLITQEGDKFTLKRTHVYGKKRKSMRFTLLADGKTKRKMLFFKSRLAWKDHILEAVLWNKGFSNAVSYRFGETENEFIADEVYKSAKHNHHNIWIFDKDNSKYPPQ